MRPTINCDGGRASLHAAVTQGQRSPYKHPLCKLSGLGWFPGTGTTSL
ncbi:MAG: hypothetical protein F6K30_14975 [Cyanothece sp. SIO2G6]|nr:hypothetical protein [Cyanothece sp. SIO2G6]